MRHEELYCLHNAANALSTSIISRQTFTFLVFCATLSRRCTGSPMLERRIVPRQLQLYPTAPASARVVHCRTLTLVKLVCDGRRVFVTQKQRPARRESVLKRACHPLEAAH